MVVKLFIVSTNLYESSVFGYSIEYLVEVLTAAIPLPTHCLLSVTRVRNYCGRLERYSML